MYEHAQSLSAEKMPLQEVIPLSNAAVVRNRSLAMLRPMAYCRKENQVIISKVFCNKADAIAAAEKMRTKPETPQDDESDDDDDDDNSDAEELDAPKAFYNHKDRTPLI